MKQVVKNYSFSAAAGTVTFTDFGSIALDRLFLITNVTSNVVVYQFNGAAYGGTVAGNILTLTYDTASMQDSDKLQIIYDCAAGDPTYDAIGSSFVSGTVAAGAADSGNPVKVGGKYNATAPTLSDGQRGDMQLDSSANLKVSSGTLLAGEDLTNNVLKVEQRFSYARTTADVQAKSGAGFVHTVTFSATGTVTSGVITLFDNTAESGTIIWSGVIQTGINPFTIILDVAFATGLYIGYDGTVAGVAVTVSFR